MPSLTYQPSRELAQAMRDAGLIPDCQTCKQSRGLCRRCAKAILPQLAKPNLWLRLMGKKPGDTRKRMTAAERRHAERYEVKKHRRHRALQSAIEGKLRRRIA